MNGGIDDELLLPYIPTFSIITIFRYIRRKSLPVFQAVPFLQLLQILLWRPSDSNSLLHFRQFRFVHMTGFCHTGEVSSSECSDTILVMACRPIDHDA